MTLPRPRGTGRNLLDAYRLIPRLRPDWEFLLYHQHPLDDDTAPHEPPWRHPNVRLRRIDMPGDRFAAWLQVRLPLAIRHDRPDLMHFPANTAPKWCPAPFVATIHDLIPLLVPGEASPEQMLAFERGVGRAVTHAARIITPSSATRDALHQRLDVPLDRMIVIPWAPDDRIAAEARQGFCPRRRQRLRDTYGLGQRWLLSFSGGTPRKNALGVLRGFARVPLHVREDFQVVLAGCEPATVRDELAREAQRLGLADRCRVLGFVPYRDLPALLRGASGLLMPSRGEGFGLPILDAFACGVPVLTSNLDSMPEVAGNAAVYCDPEDPDSIAAGIARLLNPPTAAHLVPRGYKQLARFSWERTAEAICATYEQCLRGTASKSVAPAAAALEGCPR